MLLQELTEVRRHLPLGVSYGDAFCTNPSVIMDDGRMYATLKAIYGDTKGAWYAGDYNIVKEGAHAEQRVQKPALQVEFGDDFRIARTNLIDASEILTVAEPRYLKSEFLAKGRANFSCCIEDLRLLKHHDDLAVIGTYTEYATIKLSESYCFVLDRADRTFFANLRSTRLEEALLLPSIAASRMDKNWITLQFARDQTKVCTNIDSRAVLDLDLRNRIACKSASSELEDFKWKGGWSGSTNLVPFQGQLFLGVLHRKRGQPHVYQHMFILCDDNFRIHLVSEPFSFAGCAVEFCCGFSAHTSRGSFIISFSRWDRTAEAYELPGDTLAKCINRKVLRNNDLVDHRSFEREYYDEHQSELLECVKGRQRTIELLQELLSATSRRASILQVRRDDFDLPMLDVSVDVALQEIHRSELKINLLKQMLRRSLG